MQNPHETGKDDKFNTGFAQHLRKLLFYLGLQARAKSAWRYIRVWDAKLSRDIENWGIQHI
jgi:hypothetical protein